MLAAGVQQSQPECEDCPVCQTPGAVRGVSLGEPVFECPRCRLQFLRRSVRPNTDSANDWGMELVNGPFEWGELFRKNMGKAYEQQLKLLGRLALGKTLLDFGAGPGIFLYVAKQSGWNTLGVEVSQSARRFAESRYRLSYVEHLSQVERGKFDVIRMSHVLEHIPHPLPLLKELREKLKGEGIVQVLVPNRVPLTSLPINFFRRALSPTPKLQTAIYPDMHVLGFDCASLGNILRTAGFEVLKVFTVSMGNSTYYPMLYDGYLNRMPLSKVIRPAVLRSTAMDILNNLGAPAGLGTWIVALGRNRA